MVGFFFAVVGCTLFGFCAGLFAFKVKTRWCTACGNTLGCLACNSGSRVRAAKHRAQL
ncbi:hypothetical protein ACFP2T_37620 [Plantactinospora solaniradicis]|uniref:FeoB-associated Cys-rich membrane protein n=1 Tax=Plantactinospora solaniradicis TaxID=1723736 RepID=A0ABW1KJB0_9ACTN